MYLSFTHFFALFYTSEHIFINNRHRQVTYTDPLAFATVEPHPVIWNPHHAVIAWMLSEISAFLSSRCVNSQYSCKQQQNCQFRHFGFSFFGVLIWFQKNFQLRYGRTSVENDSTIDVWRLQVSSQRFPEVFEVFEIFANFRHNFAKLQKFRYASKTSLNFIVQLKKPKSPN